MADAPGSYTLRFSAVFRPAHAPESLLMRGPGDGIYGAKPKAPVSEDGPEWTKPPEVIQHPGQHPRIKRDSGAWAGRKTAENRKV